MNVNDYLEIKQLRDTFDEALMGPAEVLTIEKADLVTLFNAALGRSYGEVEFNAKLIKITPKERRDDDILEVTLSATFDNDLLGGVGRFFGRQLTVYLEPAPQEAYDDRGDENADQASGADRHDDPNQMALPLDEEPDDQADPLTGYNGEESEPAELPTF